MRVIGRLRFYLALGAPRFRTTDRGHARGLCRSWWRESCGRCLRLRAGTAAVALRVPRFAVAALGSTRLAFTALVATSGCSWLAFTSRFASAARTFPRPFA